MARRPDNPFWLFSLELYGRPEVAKACLALQDRRGLDVNLLLFCCWAGSRGHRLDRPALEGLIEAVESWQREVVAPLRQALRHLKTRCGAAAEALRQCHSAQQVWLQQSVPRFELKPRRACRRLPLPVCSWQCR